MGEAGKRTTESSLDFTPDGLQSESLLRVYIIVGWITLSIIILVVTLIFSVRADSKALSSIAETQWQDASRFMSTYEGDYQRFVDSASSRTVPQIAELPQQEILGQITADWVSETEGLIRVVVYTPERLVVHSTTEEDIGAIHENNEGFQCRYYWGNYDRFVLSRNERWRMPDGTTERIGLGSTFLCTGRPVEAILRFDYDISEDLNQLRRNRYLLLGGEGIALVVLGFVIYRIFTTRLDATADE